MWLDGAGCAKLDGLKFYQQVVGGDGRLGHYGGGVIINIYIRCLCGLFCYRLIEYEKCI